MEPAEPSAAEPPAMSSTSEGSEDSWHVVRLEDLDDIEVVTATGQEQPVFFWFCLDFAPSKGKELR